jgi:uncharacterized membrane protein YfcA
MAASSPCTIAMTLTSIELTLACLIVAAGATVQGSVGLGLGLVAAPLLILIDPLLVPGPLLAAALTLTLLVAHRERRKIAFKDLGWALVGRFPGVGIALLTLLVLPAEAITVVFGALVLFAAGLSASGMRLRPTTRNLVGAGVISGITGTLTGIGGPPVALVYQEESGPRLRGTLAGYFLIGVTVSLIGLASVGHFGRQEIVASTALLPGIFLGFLISSRTATLLDRGHTRKAVLIVSAVGGLAVILRQAL